MLDFSEEPIKWFLFWLFVCLELLFCLLFVEWTILFKEAFCCTVQCDLLECISRNSPWNMSVALAVNGPHPRILTQTTGEKTALHVPAPPLECAGADGYRPERLAVSNEGLCCHVISRVLFHVDVHAHQNTHRCKRLAVSYFPSCDAESILLSSASFQTLSIM